MRTRGWPMGRLASLAVVGFLLAAVALSLPGALASASSPSPSPGGGVTLRIGWTTEPDNLNPFIGWANSSYEIWAMNYDFLFGTGADQKPTLGLASEWPTKENGGISPDGKVWTIHLRSDVKWQDGVPLTADDVAFTYNYVVKNHMALMAITTLGIKEAKVVDPTTVQIVCSRPKADMEQMFLPILPKHVWQDVLPQKAQSTWVNKPPIIGSGPFETVEFVRGHYLRMVANKNYFRGAPHIDGVLFVTYQNADAMVADLKSGAIDAAWGIPTAQFAGLKSSQGIAAIPYIFYNWDYLNFNCYDEPSSMGNPVLRDWRFRYALNYAVDREQLCRSAFQGYGLPGTTILPPDTWSDPDYHWQPPADQLYTYDLAEAGRLLDQAGYVRGPGGFRLYKGKPISLRLWAMTDSPQAQAEGRLIAGWFEQLGLKITFSVLDRGAQQAHLWNFKGNTYAPDFDMYIDDWAGYSDPGQTLACETTPQIGYANEPCWSSSEYDRLCDEQAATLDRQKRKDIIWRMQQIMYEQTPWIVLTYPDYLEAYNTARWTGWTRVLSGHGPAFYTTGTNDSYLNLQPRGGRGCSGRGHHRCRAVAPAPSSGGGSLMGASPGEAGATHPADIVFRGGIVYTADARRTMAEAVAVSGGRIVCVGTSDDVGPFIGVRTEVVDLGGRMLLPGFIDSHAHPSETVEYVYGVSLMGLGSVARYKEAVRAFAAEHPELPGIRGWGWSNVVAPGPGLSAADLDEVVPDRPAMIRSEDGHSLWVNTAALRLAGVAARTPDPRNGVIERDAVTGEPSGTLREGAMQLVQRTFPPYTADECAAGLLRFQEEVAAPLGITTVFNAMSVPGDPVLEAFEELQDEDRLTVRYRGGLWLQSDLPLDEQVRAAVAERARHTGSLFQTRAVKLFADGVIEGHTAYLEEAYADTPGDRGFPEWAPEDLAQASVAAAGEGFQLHYHAIGDAAVAMALDAVATARAAGVATERPGITHLQLVRPRDFARFADLGVVAIANPYWFFKDDYFYDLQVPYLGEMRAEREYPLRSFIVAGAHVASASDYPVTVPPSPLAGIQIGVTRWFPGEAKPGDVLWPEERVNVAQMIDSFTIEGAYAHFLEDETGSVEVGKSADLLVVDRDLLSVPPDEIGEAKVLLTMFRGKQVYRDPSFT